MKLNAVQKNNLDIPSAHYHSVYRSNQSMGTLTALWTGKNWDSQEFVFYSCKK